MYFTPAFLERWQAKQRIADIAEADARQYAKLAALREKTAIHREGWERIERVIADANRQLEAARWQAFELQVRLGFAQATQAFLLRKRGKV